MTAPVASVRVNPQGIKLDDGFPTFIVFAADPDVSLWEKTVKPPGLDGGDPIDTTTMLNDNLRTFASRSLKTMTPMTTTMAYDPKVFSQLLTLINVETTITVRFPNGDTLAFYGYLRSFEPNEISEGEQPTASVTIQPTNQDPTTGNEENFVLTLSGGT